MVTAERLRGRSALGRFAPVVSRFWKLFASCGAIAEWKQRSRAHGKGNGGAARRRTSGRLRADRECEPMAWLSDRRTRAGEEGLRVVDLTAPRSSRDHRAADR